MLKNKKVVYFCQECGYESSKWMGQCPGCKAWNTFVEEAVSTKKNVVFRQPDYGAGAETGACKTKRYTDFRG